MCAVQQQINYFSQSTKLKLSEVKKQKSHSKRQDLKLVSSPGTNIISEGNDWKLQVEKKNN